jgi:hypothetical protein
MHGRLITAQGELASCRVGPFPMLIWRANAKGDCGRGTTPDRSHETSRSRSFLRFSVRSVFRPTGANRLRSFDLGSGFRPVLQCLHELRSHPFRANTCRSQVSDALPRAPIRTRLAQLDCSYFLSSPRCDPARSTQSLDASTRFRGAEGSKALPLRFNCRSMVISGHLSPSTYLPSRGWHFGLSASHPMGRF